MPPVCWSDLTESHSQRLFHRLLQMQPDEVCGWTASAAQLNWFTEHSLKMNTNLEYGAFPICLITLEQRWDASVVWIILPLVYAFYFSVWALPYGACMLRVRTLLRPAGCLPPACSDIPGCGPLSREDRMSVAAELPSGTKLVWMRSLICLCFDTEPLTGCRLCLHLALAVPLKSAPPSVFFCVSHVHANTNTHLCLLKERGRGEEGDREGHWKRGHRKLRRHLRPRFTFFRLGPYSEKGFRLLSVQ